MFLNRYCRRYDSLRKTWLDDGTLVQDIVLIPQCYKARASHGDGFPLLGRAESFASCVGPLEHDWGGSPLVTRGQCIEAQQKRQPISDAVW